MFVTMIVHGKGIVCQEIHYLFIKISHAKFFPFRNELTIILGTQCLYLLLLLNDLFG